MELDLLKAAALEDEVLHLLRYEQIEFGNAIGVRVPDKHGAQKRRKRSRRAEDEYRRRRRRRRLHDAALQSRQGFVYRHFRSFARIARGTARPPTGGGALG